jgi:hypothetical protein
MAGRKRAPAKSAKRAAKKAATTKKATRPQATRDLPKRDLPQLLGAAVRDISWMRRLPPERLLKPGTPVEDHIRVPVKDAQVILRSTVRLVADLPTDASPDVVWVKGNSELMVHTNRIGIDCDDGLVTINVRVSCDQLRDGGTVAVPFAVGTAEAPSGLVMSTFTRPHGPELILPIWGEAITAFAWEALLHLAQQLSGEVGKDTQNRPLVPAEVGAAPGELLIRPMARHDLWQS